MPVKDTPDGYGIVSRLFHWIMAVAIFGLFALGWWMVKLDYYSPYYVSAPDLHRSVGIVLFIALIARIMWRAINVKPKDADLNAFERKASWLVHFAFYPLLIALSISGYLIATPDGRPIDVFGWFKVPSIIQQKGLEDTAGLFHWVIAYTVIALAVIHTAAALKHHVIDKGSSLKRMWSGPRA